MKTVSLIIVNYNGRQLLQACIASLLSQSFTDFEIIVVDNASQDGSVEYIDREFPQVKTIALARNTGFAAANNEGLKQAQGQYIALLNNDAEADGDWLGNLVAGMKKDGAVGICASKMLVYGTTSIDSAGDGFATNLKGFKRGEGQPADRYAEEEYIFGACAGAALYRRSMLDEIGFFDDDFFLIHEDTDINLRAQLAGWKVLYVPAAIAYHKVRASIGDMSDTAIFYTLRNSEYVRLKNIPLRLFLRCLPPYVIGSILDFLYFGVKHRSPLLYVKAKAGVFRAMKRMLCKRKEIMERRKVDSMYIYSMMTPFLKREFFLTKIMKFLRG